jgi:uncharacterized protein (UPF0548 family)
LQLPDFRLVRRRGDIEARLSALRGRPLNSDPSRVHDTGWHRDDYRQPLPREQPGEPEPGGSWRIACRLSRDYAFSDPSRVEAHFDHEAPLEGREMLLVLHVLRLRFDAGVRVAHVYDGARELDGRPARLFSWSYRTLEGHVEAGQRDFEVWKRLDSGEVEFRTHSLSRPAAQNPVMLTGVRLLGPHKQAEFGRRACARMLMLTAAASGAVAPA